MSENRTWDVIVVGGGAAGLSAALLLGRARRSVLVLDAGRPRNRFAGHMHGVLGNEGAAPTEFLDRARDEVAGYGVQVREGVVASASDQDSQVRVLTESGEELFARRLVAASGVWDDLPNIGGLAERWGRDVLHCPYCHGWEVRDKRLAVIATSPMGAHQAQLIRQWSDDVVFFTGRAGVLDDRVTAALAARNVVCDSRPVTELVIDDDRLVGVRVEGDAVIAVDAVFTAGTLRPHDGYLTSLGLERAESLFGSFLKVDPTGRTSNAKTWAVGNIAAPGATVPMAIAAGASAAGALNMDLITEEFDMAVAATDEARRA